MMLALGEEHATKLFTHMDDEEIRELSQTMANLGTVSSTIIERLFVEFAEQISSTGSLVGTCESTERLLMKVLDNDKVNQIMEDIRGPAGRTMWDKLANVNETVLANYLKNSTRRPSPWCCRRSRREHAPCLAQLPESFAMEVVMRMSPCTVQKEVLDDVERTLRTEHVELVRAPAAATPHEMMAEIFNNPTATPKAASWRRGRAQPRQRRAHQGPDVHLRGPVQARSVRRPDPAAGRQAKLGPALKGSSETPATCSSPTCRNAPPRSCGEDGGHGRCTPATWTSADVHGSGGEGPCRPRRDRHGRGQGEDELIYSAAAPPELFGQNTIMTHPQAGFVRYRVRRGCGAAGEVSRPRHDGDPPLPPEPEEPPPPEPVFKSADLLQAHEDGYADGSATASVAEKAASVISRMLGWPTSLNIVQSAADTAHASERA